MPAALPIASAEKTAAALEAIGAQAMGRSEVWLYKQILVAVAATGNPDKPTVAPVLSGSLAPPDLNVAELTWTASDKEDSAGFAYEVQGSLNGGAYTLLDTTGPYVLAANVGPLAEGSWNIRVRPRNDAGVGPVSNVLNFVVWYAPTLAPVLSGFAEFLSFIAELSWTASNKLDSPGFEYRVDYDKDAAGWTELDTYGPGVTSASPDLTSTGAGSYDFRVTPINDIGEGPSSNTVNIVLPGESSASYLLLNGGGRLLLNSGGALLING